MGLEIIPLKMKANFSNIIFLPHLLNDILVIKHLVRAGALVVMVLTGAQCHICNSAFDFHPALGFSGNIHSPQTLLLNTGQV